VCVCGVCVSDSEWCVCMCLIVWCVCVSDSECGVCMWCVCV